MMIIAYVHGVFIIKAKNVAVLYLQDSHILFLQVFICLFSSDLPIK